jgi:hypothetical protein
MYSGQALQKGEESSIRAGEGAVTVANAGGRSIISCSSSGRLKNNIIRNEKGGILFFYFLRIEFYIKIYSWFNYFEICRSHRNYI